MRNTTSVAILFSQLHFIQPSRLVFDPLGTYTSMYTIGQIDGTSGVNQGNVHDHKDRFLLNTASIPWTHL